MRVLADENLLWETVVGSHLWGMNKPDSDIDYFSVFNYPTKIFLQGYNPQLSFFHHYSDHDVHKHEISKVIEQLSKCNINFIIGVMSNKISHTSKYHRELYEYVKNNPCKGIEHSIWGLANGNYNKYILSGIDTSEKRCNKILRVLQFGITLLNTGKYEFRPFYGGTPEMILQKSDELIFAYNNSKLPITFDERWLRNYLYNVRIDYLKEVKK